MRLMSGSLLAVAMALLVGSASLRAADPVPVPTTGTISGKVIDANGNAVANADVKLVVPPAKKGAATAPAAQAAAPKGPAPLQETTTDKDGKFAFKDVLAATYNITVTTSDKPAMTGRATKVVVVAGQDNPVKDITVTAKGQKAPKAPAAPAAPATN